MALMEGETSDVSDRPMLTYNDDFPKSDAYVFSGTLTRQSIYAYAIDTICGVRIRGGAHTWMRTQRAVGT